MERSEAGNAWSHGQDLALSRSIARDVSGIFGPWTNQAHLAPQNVDQLWQLVYSGTAQKTANGCYPWIVPRGDPWPLSVCARAHASKLVKPEHAPPLADPPGFVKRRTSGCQLDGKSSRQEKG
jgi:hypothetical protein